MKPIPLILCGVAVLPLSTHAQWIVEDPAAIAQSAVHHSIELAQYVEMVSNQVEQINLLTSQLDEITAYVEAFGDPSSLLSITRQRLEMLEEEMRSRLPVTPQSEPETDDLPW